MVCESVSYSGTPCLQQLVKKTISQNLLPWINPRSTFFFKKLFFWWRDQALRTLCLKDTCSTLWQHCWQEASEFLLTKKPLLEGVEQPKILPKNPENALSDALSMTRFQNLWDLCVRVRARGVPKWAARCTQRNGSCHERIPQVSRDMYVYIYIYIYIYVDIYLFIYIYIYIYVYIYTYVYIYIYI